MQKGRSLLYLLSTKTKKLVTGAQPPQNGWKVEETRTVKLSSNLDCPLVKLRTGTDEKYIAWLIDSGASMNIMDEVSFKEYFPDSVLRPIPDNLSFTTADGSPLQVIGMFSTIFVIGKLRIMDDVYVCKGVTKSRLLGSSLLSKFQKWGIDNTEGVFRADNEEVPLIYTAGSPPRTCNVRLKHNVDIPAKSYCYVQAELPNHYEPSEFIFYPEYKIFRKKKVAMPVSLVASNALDGMILVKVTNPNLESKRMGKGTKLGKVEANLHDYVLTQGSTEEGKSEINSVQATSKQNLIDRLKQKNPDLYTLYLESGKYLNDLEKNQFLQLLCKYFEVFSIDDDDIGTSNIITHKIVPKSDKIVYRRQYRHSEEQQKQIDEEVDKLLKNGVVKESMSPFNNPVLMVPKKEPGKWRFCLDCRYINDLTEDQYFPIPLIEEVMDSLAGAKVFSTLDMTSGYHQVLLDEETSNMCAFSTRKGHFQYNRLPMGLRNSGMTFQKMVTLIMSGMLYSEVLAYLDDCVLYSPSIELHFKTLDEVLKRFKEAGLKLKPRKCHMFQKEIVYLGFLVDAKGIRPNPEAVKKIKDLPQPTNVTEVQRFLGKINYYRKFIPKLANIAHPLYSLTEVKSRNKFEWSIDHQNAFDKLKEIISSNQVMGHPDFKKEFILDVDASDFALGAELSQIESNGDERPIFYASRHLEKEKCYSATARETLAAVFGCEYFNHYLQGKKFLLRTDHNPLVWLRSMKNPKRPYSSWIVRLEQFNYTIKYRPGKSHTNADFNSRIKANENDDKRSIAVQTEPFVHKNAAYQPVEDHAINSLQYVHKNAGYLLDMENCENSLQCAHKNAEYQPDTDNVENSLQNVHKNAEYQQDKNNVENNLQNMHKNAENPSIEKKYSTKNTKINDNDKTVNTGTPIMSTKIELSQSKDENVNLLSELQAKDEDIGPVVKMLVDPKKELTLTAAGEKLWKNKSKLLVKDNLLVKHYRFRAGLRPIEQIILPKCLKNMVLESLHDNEWAGHFGIKRTTARVKMRYYWPGYQQDIEEWCKTCIICQQRKNPTSKNTAPMTSIHSGQGPFEQIGLDILKLPRTERGYEYLLVLEDYFSKWIEAFPMKRTAAPGVAQCMLNGWVSRFGCPYSILSDQGSEFTSRLFKCLSDTLQARKLRTTTYHPRTDGMVERSNRTIIDVLSKYAEKEPDWDLRLPLVLFAIRTSEHATTGFSPFKLVYGQEARIPWDVVYGPAPSEPLPQDEWVAARKQEMIKIFDMVRKQTQTAQLHQKKYFDKNLKGKFITFDKGEKVMYCDPARRIKEGKLHRPWSGPYVVSEKISDALYKVSIGGSDVMVNSERLKKYHPRVAIEEENLNKSGSDESDDDYDDLPVQDNPVENVAPINDQPEVRPNIREPMMREGGRLWCNVDPRNRIPSRLRNRNN